MLTGSVVVNGERVLLFLLLGGDLGAELSVNLVETVHVIVISKI